MLKYIDEDYYLNNTKKTELPKDFERLNIEASSYINHETVGRIDINNIPDEVKYTTCLIIDLLQSKETKLTKIGNLKSQNIEGWSETYATPEEIEKEYSDEMYSTLKKYLWNITGKNGKSLLNCGVC